MKALVVAAHPDDEVLGCGGTIACLAKDGHEVHVVILGEGATSRYASRDRDSLRAARRLACQGRKVAELLGVKDILTHNLPDNRFDTVPLLDVVKLVEDAIRRTKPVVIYTHHGGDLNIDHAIAHRATLTATRPTLDSPVRDVFAYEAPSSTEWAFANVGPPFRPNVFVDITSTLARKIEAMQLYESEAREFPHPRSPEALEANARRWGSVSGVEAAEAFELVRSIPRPGR